MSEPLFPDCDLRARTPVERRIDAKKEEARKLEQLGHVRKAKRLRSQVKTMERKYTVKMLHEVKLNLTYAGRCVNPECRAPLYRELMREPDQEACDECNPPREGLPTTFRLIAAADMLSQQAGHCTEGCCSTTLAAVKQRSMMQPGEVAACVACGGSVERRPTSFVLDDLRCNGRCIPF